MNILKPHRSYAFAGPSANRPTVNLAQAHGFSASPGQQADSVVLSNVAAGDIPSDALSPMTNQPVANGSSNETFQEFRSVLRQFHSLPGTKARTFLVNASESEFQSKSVDQQLFGLCVDIFVGDGSTKNPSQTGADTNDVSFSEAGSHSLGLIADEARMANQKSGVSDVECRARQKALSIYLQNGGPGSLTIEPYTHQLLEVALGL